MKMDGGISCGMGEGSINNQGFALYLYDILTQIKENVGEENIAKKWQYQLVKTCKGQNI